MVGQVRGVGVVAGVCICKWTCKSMEEDRCRAMPVGGSSVGRAVEGDQCSADGGVMIGVVRVVCKHIGVGSQSGDECLC